ncbi:MAG TPA: CPBP family intramembrane metalloprotease [bacterium]|nr:CPBP family intramembrane metalloprotease [bacterium]
MEPKRAYFREGPLRFALELTVIYLLPVIALKLLFPGREFSRHFKEIMVFFVCWSAAAGYYAHRSGFSWKEVGLTARELPRSFLFNLLVVAVAAGVIVLLAGPRLFEAQRMPRTTYWFPLFYIFLSCPAQEFLYRGLLFGLMERAGLRHPALLILLTAATYASMHILFHKPLIVPLTFAIGIVWGTLYWRVRNLWGLIVAHIALGFLSMAAGLA